MKSWSEGGPFIGLHGLDMLQIRVLEYLQGFAITE